MVSSSINKCLWAFAYVATAGVSVYATAHVMGTNPKSVVSGWFVRSEQPAVKSFVQTFQSVSTIETKSNDNQAPHFEIGPFDTSKPIKKECELSPDDVKDAKERQASRLNEFRKNNADPMQNFAYLYYRYKSLGQCADNLKILDLDKKQFFMKFRQASITEIQRMYRALQKEEDTEAVVRSILDIAAYAGISDDGTKNVTAGLEAARLPNEDQLHAIADNKVRISLSNNLNTVRSFTGGGVGVSRGDASFALIDLKFALMDNPGRASSLGITANELKQIEDRLDADRDSEQQEYDRANPGPQPR